MIPVLQPLAIALTTGLLLIATANAHGGLNMKFRATGAGGEGGFEGEMRVTGLTQQGAVSFRRVTGAAKQISKGFGLMVAGPPVALAAGYGAGLKGVLVCQNEAGKISARWQTASDPAMVEMCEFTGAAQFTGKLSSTSAVVKALTITPGKGGVFQAEIDASGVRQQGVGLQSGNTFVAAFGNAGSGLGVAFYTAASDGNSFAGTWAASSSTSPGTETLEPAPNRKFGQGIELQAFGTPFSLQDSRRDVRAGVADMRAYTPPGENSKSFSKMLTIALTQAEAAPADVAALSIKTMAERVGNKDGRIVARAVDAAFTTQFNQKGEQPVVFVTCYRSVTNPFAFPKKAVLSVQFVAKLPAELDTLEKLQAERDRHLDEWIEELTALADDGLRLLDASEQELERLPVAPKPDGSPEKPAPKVPEPPK